MYGQALARAQVGTNVLSGMLEARGPAAVDSAGRLWFGRWPVGGDHRVVDAVKAQTGADATIFGLRGGVPYGLITTVLKAHSHERNDGTELIGRARTAFEHGTGFTGTSALAGRPFVNNYVLVRDAHGRVVALAYAGSPLAEMNAAIAQTSSVIILTAAIGFVALLGLQFAVVRPIGANARAVVRAATGLAGGDVQQSVSIRSHDEFREIGVAFAEMIAYQQRMAAAATAIAAGDLSADVTPASENDQLAHAFGAMIGKLRELMSGIAASSGDLVEVSKHSALSCDESAIAVDQVAAATSAIAEGAHRQIGGISSAQDGVAGLSVTAAQIASGSRTQSDAAGEATQAVAEVDRQISAVAELGDVLAKKAQGATAETQTCAQAVGAAVGFRSRWNCRKVD